LANWSPFFHGSGTRAWRDGFLKRPIYFILGDEDAVTCGTDWIPLLTGSREFNESGQVTQAGRPPLFWSCIPKNCHDGWEYKYAPPAVFGSRPFFNCNAQAIPDYLAYLSH